MLKLSKNGIKTLKKQYSSVLLKCLAINAGLFMLATPVMAMDLVINAGDSITTKDLPLIGKMDKDNHRPIVHYYDLVQVDGGKFEVDCRHLDAGTVLIKSGNVKFNDAYLTTHDGDFYISGGNIVLDNDGGFSSGYLEISGNAVINTDHTPIQPDNLKITGGTIYSKRSDLGSDGPELLISGGTINLAEESAIYVTPDEDDTTVPTLTMTGGTINMDNSYIASNSFVDTGSYELYTAGNVDFTGGIINVNKGDNVLVSKDPNIGSTLNIAKGATLTIWENYKDYEDISDDLRLEFYNKGTMVLAEKGELNLSGTLAAKLKGEGTLNVNSKDAAVQGKVSGVNVSINSDSSLSKLAALGMSKLNHFNIQNGVTFQIADLNNLQDDNPLYLANEIKVNPDAELSIINSDVKTTEKSEQTYDIAVFGKVNLKNAVLEAGNDSDSSKDNSNIYLSGASVSMDNADLEANGGIKMKNTTLTSKTDSDSSAEKCGVWSDKNIEVTDSKVNLQNSYLAAAGDIKISGNSEINLDKDSEMLVVEDGEIDISGGHLTATDSEIHSDGIVVSGGEIVLNGDTDFTAVSHDKNFLLTGGKVTMNGGGAVIGTNENCNGTNCTAGSFKMTGGKIVVNGNAVAGNKEFNSNYLEGADISISGGSLTVSKNAYLETISGMVIDANEDPLELKKSTMNVLQKGVLNLGGTLSANVNMQKGSVMNVGGDKAMVDGDVAFEAGSTLSVIATNKDEYGSLTANKVTISEDDTTLKMAFNGGVVAKGETVRLQILDAEKLDGEFANQPENARYKIEYLGNGLYEITGVADTGDILAGDGDENQGTNDDSGSQGGSAGDNSGTGDNSGSQGGNAGDNSGTGDNSGSQGGNAGKGHKASENIISIAKAWDKLNTGKTKNKTTVAVAEKLTELSNSTQIAAKKAYKDALAALAPETAPAVQASQIQISNQVFNAVGMRLSGGSYAGQRGVASGDGYSNTAVWVQGMLNKAKYDKSAETEFDSDTWGTAIGLEKQLNYATKVGVGYAYSKTDIEGFKRDTDVKTHTALVYGEFKPSNWFANFVASYGWSDYEESKNVVGINVKGSYDVETFGLQAMTGYDINLSTVGDVLTPETGVRYIHIGSKAYTDAAGQYIDNNNSDILTGVIGLNFATRYRIINTNIRIKPEARAVITYDIATDDAKSTVALPNGAIYKTEGEGLNRFGVEFGAGVTAELNDNLDLSLGYEGKFRSDYQDHTGLINAKVKF